ncbi:Lysophospholipase, alpha-beta hydrolase superfamily [Kosakonia arachidis]|uniref:Lysophospholipase, alpha-beta hydrolase superfamily n=1 Tax=Kosakonia arachidis TaxID=551989 RepID=A0A1I6ZLF8_9ENTR|nr:alpha/beta hydrolase [Kosakonia arachidis]SFT63553.1 Lysophospholipase, alpha-beta hydrolase superfamily [Kosakonia arachidis]
MRRVVALVIMMLMLAGCQHQPIAQPPLGQASFADYQSQTRDYVRAHRAFQTLDKTAELALNTPQEWRSAQPARKGILLIHGLGDGPGSFVDIAPALAKQGFLVRTVLLPGHGTRPSDLLTISVDQWRQVVREQADILAKEVDTLWIGGFSTGGNLALEYAMTHHDRVQGLLLFSPAFKSNTAYDFLAPTVALFRDWLRPPSTVFPQQIVTRYLRVPTNGFAQFWRTSASAQRWLARKSWDKPALIVLTEHDSVLNTRWILDHFDRNFPHPASRMIWYGTSRPDVANVSRILVKTDFLPQDRISQFSHMSVLFSPQNPLYGRKGSVLICANGQPDDATKRCLKGDEVWYSDWGLVEAGKIHARLTWNPWFDWQTAVMDKMVSATL